MKIECNDERDQLEKLVEGIIHQMKKEKLMKHLFFFIKVAESKNINITYEMLKVANSKYEIDCNDAFLPEFVLDFIIDYLKNIAPNNILDPISRFGSIIIPITQNLNLERAVATISHDEMKLINNFQDNFIDIEWESPDLDHVFYKNDSYDAIVSFPPINELKNKAELTSKREEKVIISESKENLWILKSLMSLKEEGTGLIIMNSNFLSKKGNQSILSNLEKFDLYIDAALEIPRSNFSIVRGSSTLLIIKRKKPLNVFIGELTENKKSKKILLENLIERKSAKFPRLGTLININDFASFKKVFNEPEIKKIAKRAKLKAFPILKITNEINLYNEKTGFEEKFNSIYLPKIGNSLVVDSLEKLVIKPHNYIQLVLKYNLANSEYLANFLNSELGQKIRSSLETGYIPKINKSNLIESEVYLPDLNIQKEVVKANNSIRDILTQLEIEKRNLWKYPRKVNETQKIIEKVDMSYKISDWRDSLPFPIASILWEYETQIDNMLRFKYLLRFFEAFSQFNFAILLSAVKQNNQFYKDYFKECIENTYENWFIEPDFGIWNHLGSCFASKIRKILKKDDEDTETCYRLFGNPNKEFLKVITSKEIYRILNEARIHRNRWDAHDTPSIPQEECNKRIEILLKLLYDLKELTSDLYSTILFFMATGGGCDGGECSYDIRKLKGPNARFKKDKIKVSPDSGLPNSSIIYFVNEDQIDLIKVVPILKMMESPKTEHNACYFYSRVEEDGIRLVTYHYKQKFEMHLSSDSFDLINILSSL